MPKSKVQRKIVTKLSDPEDAKSPLVDSDGNKIYRLKNILPSGVIYIADMNEKAYKIEAGSEIDLTEEEFENNSECHGFKEGYFIFCDTYKGHDEFSNYMSDNKISDLLKLSIKKFEIVINTLDSFYVFQRIRQALIKAEKPSGYLAFLDLHESNLKAQYLKSQEYETDVEKNRSLYSRPLSR